MSQASKEVIEPCKARWRIMAISVLKALMWLLLASVALYLGYVKYIIFHPRRYVLHYDFNI